MQIPSDPAGGQNLLTFRQALAGTGSDDYDRDHWLYVPDFYTGYRYILGTRGRNSLICIGINPSTAVPDHLDPTLKSVERIAHHNGYDSFLMLNVYAQRATKPQDMDIQCNATLHRENMEAFAHLLSQPGAPASLWAAWGNLIETRPYLKTCLADVLAIARHTGAVWYTAGPRSRKGHPHHPLYLKKDIPLEPFDAQTYWDACL